MIRGIHYFSTELKTKIDVIPMSCFDVPINRLCNEPYNDFNLAAIYKENVVYIMPFFYPNLPRLNGRSAVIVNYSILSHVSGTKLKS